MSAELARLTETSGYLAKPPIHVYPWFTFERDLRDRLNHGHRLELARSLLEFGQPDLVIALSREVSDMPVYVPPREHEGSCARYLIDGAPIGDYGRNHEGRIVPKDLCYLSIMAPETLTSRHAHSVEPRVQEGYWIVRGGVTLCVERAGRRIETALREGQGFVVRPGEVHQAIAGKKGAVLLIVMQNGNLVPPHARHQRE